jgi:hypothetical protein
MTITVIPPVEENIQVTPPVSYQITATTTGAPGLSAYEIWLADGNTGTEQDFLDSLVGSPGPIAGLDKQVQFNDAGTGGVDRNLQWDKNTKTLRVGIEDDLPLPNNPLAMVGAINSYFQMNIKNTQEGPLASSDYVATADNGTDVDFYADFGINSSVYDSPDYEAFKANDGYVIAAGGDLDLCTTKDRIRLIVGGTMEADVVGEITAAGIEVGGELLATVTNRPEIFSGTGSPPLPTGLANGSVFFKYVI